MNTGLKPYLKLIFIVIVMLPNDLGEKLNMCIDVEIGKKYYHSFGTSAKYVSLTIIGKRYYPEERTDNGFIYTLPSNVMAVGNILDPSGYNKFFKIIPPSAKVGDEDKPTSTKQAIPDTKYTSKIGISDSSTVSPDATGINSQNQDEKDIKKNISFFNRNK